MKRILSFAIVVQLVSALPVVAAARVGPENNEGNTDAGSLPGDAHRTTGNGALSTIRRTLESASGVSGAVLDLEDMYLIRIDDPANFQATTVPVLGGSADFDSRLFLFHADFGPEGQGILGNNDTFIPGLGKGEFSSGSTLTNQATDETGAEVTQAGLYYLAITVNPRGPISEGGQIFRFDFISEISGPDGDGGGSVVIAWEEDLPPTGACCASKTLECTIETQADCEKAFGTYQGDGTTCDPDPCAPVQGACCFGESCAVMTAGDCNGQEGEYLGNGTNCADAPCELGACCFKGSFCVLENQVAPLNQGFTPGAQEVAEAGKLLEAYQAAVAGGAASIRQGDRIIDSGMAHQAQSIIDRAAACEAHDKAKVDALAGRPVPAP